MYENTPSLKLLKVVVIADPCHQKKFLSRGYFLKYSHLAIPAKLHCPKGDRINESLLYFFILYFCHNESTCSRITQGWYGWSELSQQQQQI